MKSIQQKSSHTIWECKYHIVWIPKYRKKKLYKELRQYIGEMLRDLECELTTLAIVMQTFIAILDEIAKIDGIVNRNEDLVSIIDVLSDTTQRSLGFRCES